jgi:hypothetical protein
MDATAPNIMQPVSGMLGLSSVVVGMSGWTHLDRTGLLFAYWNQLIATRKWIAGCCCGLREQERSVLLSHRRLHKADRSINRAWFPFTGIISALSSTWACQTIDDTGSSIIGF